MPKQPKIIHAERDRIEDLKPYVDKTLEALGHPEAFVTNESMVGDFVPLHFSSEERQAFMDKLGEKLGLAVNPKYNDYIWDIAKRLMN